MNNGNGTQQQPPGQLMTVPQAGQVTQAGFGNTSIELRGETASSALAAQAKAAVEARYIMAMRNPRDVMRARERLLQDCRRGAFAAKAIYHKPIGEGIEGPSIRLAEAAARAMTNIDCKTAAIYDDARMRIVRVMVTDLETNITFDKDVTVTKQVERNRLREGQTAIATRIGSKGQTVYVVAATDDEILDRENALISKSLRTCLLRVIPGDLIDEAMLMCRATQKAGDEKDPATSRARMCDAFAEIGVTVEQLAEYLGHSVDRSTSAELNHMRSLYSAIEDGETSWKDALEARVTSRGPAAPADAAAASAPAQQEAKTAAPAQATAPAASKPAPAPTGKPATLADAAARSKAQRQAQAPAQTPTGPAGSSDPADQLPDMVSEREPGSDL